MLRSQARMYTWLNGKGNGGEYGHMSALINLISIAGGIAESAYIYIYTAETQL